MTTSADPLKGRTWQQGFNRWVCKWCMGRGCLSCPNGEPVLNAPMPRPAPTDEPAELIDHVFENDGSGRCKYVMGKTTDGQANVVCFRRTEVHHLLMQISTEDMANPNSEAFRVFRAAVGREAIVKAFSPGGGGHDEVRANIAREREAIAREHAMAMARGDEPVMIACPHCGTEQEDHDGFGVLKCDACGYCSHASVNGGVCGLCDKEVPA